MNSWVNGPLVSNVSCRAEDRTSASAVKPTLGRLGGYVNPEPLHANQSSSGQFRFAPEGFSGERGPSVTVSSDVTRSQHFLAKSPPVSTKELDFESVPPELSDDPSSSNFAGSVPRSSKDPNEALLRVFHSVFTGSEKLSQERGPIETRPLETRPLETSPLETRSRTSIE